MSGGLRFRSECKQTFTATPVAAGTQTIIAAATVTSAQRIGVYRFIIEAISAQATFQFQDSGGTNQSAIYTLATLGSMVVDTPINGDPWFQGGAGLGMNLITTGGTVSFDIFTAPGI